MKTLLALALLSAPAMADNYPVDVTFTAYTVHWPTYLIEDLCRTCNGGTRTVTSAEALTGPVEQVGKIAGTAFAYAIQKMDVRFNPQELGGDVQLTFAQPLANSIRIRAVSFSAYTLTGVQFSHNGKRWYQVPPAAFVITNTPCNVYKTPYEQFPTQCYVWETVVPVKASSAKLWVKKGKNQDGSMSLMKVAQTDAAPWWLIP